jgi:hypothetical protein
MGEESKGEGGKSLEGGKRITRGTRAAIVLQKGKENNIVSGENGNVTTGSKDRKQNLRSATSGQ